MTVDDVCRARTLEGIQKAAGDLAREDDALRGLDVRSLTVPVTLGMARHGFGAKPLD